MPEDLIGNGLENCARDVLLMCLLNDPMAAATVVAVVTAVIADGSSLQFRDENHLTD